MNSKKKTLFFICVILLLIVLGFLVKQSKRLKPVEGITSTWETFYFNNKEFSYPPSWQIEKIQNPLNKKETLSVRVFKKDSDEKEMEIFIGSDKGCEELKVILCLGKNPVYTNSQNSEVMQLFNMFVRINENPHNKK